MAGILTAACLLFVVCITVPELVSAENHHVVGGDDGWSPDANINSWLSGRVFSVGDKIWFTYPAEKDIIVELESLEELVSCDLRNPIRMYADGVNHVTLEKEGTRFFASGDLERCKNGMKLPVPVEPRSHEYDPDLRPPYDPDLPPRKPEPLPEYPPPSPPSYAAACGLHVPLLTVLVIIAGVYVF